MFENGVIYEKKGHSFDLFFHVLSNCIISSETSRITMIHPFVKYNVYFQETSLCFFIRIYITCYLPFLLFSTFSNVLCVVLFSRTYYNIFTKSILHLRYNCTHKCIPCPQGAHLKKLLHIVRLSYREQLSNFKEPYKLNSMSCTLKLVGRGIFLRIASNLNRKIDFFLLGAKFELLRPERNWRFGFYFHDN